MNLLNKLKSTAKKMGLTNLLKDSRKWEITVKDGSLFVAVDGKSVEYAGGSWQAERKLLISLDILCRDKNAHKTKPTTKKTKLSEEYKAIRDAMMKANQFSVLDTLFDCAVKKGLSKWELELLENVMNRRRNTIKRVYKSHGIFVGLTKKEAKLLYKKQALIHHPDRGGDVETFKAMKASYKTMMACQ